MSKSDCIIIGAGLSGLASALTLHRVGFKILILEKNETVGGRVRTDLSNQGLRTDAGFQVLLNSYPELATFIDLNSLNLKKFNSGALIYNGKELELLANPLLHPETLLSSLFKTMLTAKDKALVIKLIATSQLHRTDSPLGEKSTARFLKDFGFSENFIELFWRPFLTGIYLDPELELGDQFFRFLMRCFSTGKVCIPENGMAELPLQMSKQLPAESILFNQHVKTFSHNQVTLKNGEQLEATKVICAFNYLSSAESSSPNDFRMVTTYYFTGEELAATKWGKWLVLVPQKLGFAVSHLCLISAVSAKYGAGNPLLSVSVVGPKEPPISQVLSEVNQIAKRDLKLELVKSYVVSKALPRMTKETPGFKVTDGVVYCGDQWASPSINGALRSGRMAGEFVIKNLKTKPNRADLS